MANPKPLKRQPGGGRSVRLSAYLTPAQVQRLEAHLRGMTPSQRSREVARLLLGAIESKRE